MDSWIAIAKCESDGAVLEGPKNDDEKEFIANITMGGFNLWNNYMNARSNVKAFVCIFRIPPGTVQPLTVMLMTCIYLIHQRFLRNDMRSFSLHFIKMKSKSYLVF